MATKHRVGVLAGLIFALLLLAAGRPTEACSIPVYEYALQRWLASPFDVVVFHEGKLPAEKQKLLELLREYEAGDRYNSNVFVTDANLSGDLQEGLRELWKETGDAELPHMVVVSPPDWRPAKKVWSAPFTASNVERLLDSPVRRKVARRILDGQTAVWVLLESGNPEQDEKATETLQKELDRITGELEEQMAMMYPPAPPGSPEGQDQEPSVEFSVVRMSRNAGAEQAFKAMLLQSEKGLTDYSEPMAFPFFGRGRALFALVGEGINEQNIAEACGFLAGWCSCTAKAMAPGKDMLLSVHWDMHLWNEQPPDEELPSLVGLSEFMASAKKAEAAESEKQQTETTAPEAETGQIGQPIPTGGIRTGAEASEQPEDSTGGGFLRSVLLAVAGLVVAVGGISVIALRKGK